MKKLFTIILFLFITRDCLFAQTDPPAFESGITSDSVYINQFYKIEFSVPKGWIIDKKTQLEAIVRTGTDALAGDNNYSKAALETSLKRTGYLLMANKYLAGAPVALNPSLILMSEDLSASPGVLSGADYLYHVKQSIDLGQALESKEIKKIIINGKEFGVMDATAKKNASIKQTYYSTIINRHSIVFIITYGTDEQYADLKAAIDSFREIKN